MRRNKKKLKHRTKKIFQAHRKITMSFLIFYLLFSLIFDPRFLVNDFRDKYKALADDVSVTLHVANLPSQPVVSGTPGCDSESPYINLSWNATTDTDSYDIYRDSLPLVTGLTGHSYHDTSVNINSTYSYQVIARGPAGQTASEEITITSEEKCETPFSPACQITSFQNKSIEDHHETTDRTPLFSGTTNMPNAQIQITITSNPVFGFTTANANGYWSWQSPMEISYGTHTITVTATDPLDSSHVAADSKVFKISREKTEESHPSVTHTSAGQKEKETAEKKQSENIPLEMILSVNNPDHALYPGDNLSATLKVSRSPGDFKDGDYKIHWSILDEKNEIFWESDETASLRKEGSIEKNIPVSPLAPKGNYKIQAGIVYKGNTISADDNFTIKEIPLITAGPISLTFYDLMKALGWLVWILSFIFLLFLIWLGIEHRLSRQAYFHITENYLAKNGFISKRKGVSR